MGCAARLLLSCLLVLSAASAGGVVHMNGDGSGNTTPPADDPGFANVGITPNGLSGVYLGNGWVLTASHVGEHPFEFQGVAHPVVVGSRSLIWKDGLKADLALIELAGPPPALPDVVLSTASPVVGEIVTLVGNGWSREAQLTCWAAGWVEVACPGGIRSGYERSGPRVMRWGINALTTANTQIPLGATRTLAFGAVFDEAGTPDESQIVTGDSGGAAFLKRAGQWELVGIHFGISRYAGQPTDSAVFGNTGYSADVFHYRAEIEAIALPVDMVPFAPLPAFVLGFGVLLAVARRSLPRR